MVSVNGSSKIEVTTIDKTVESNEIITFIKMDIEGSEFNALKGATKTIKRCNPKLAISGYHRKDDLIQIPQFIKSIQLDDSNIQYKFYLRQYTRFNCDFVLYAIPFQN